MIKRGRPPKGAIVGKSAAFATRITPELRLKLEQAAGENGRSLSQEAEFRLSASFAADKEGGGHTHQTRALVGLLAEAISRAQTYTGQPWTRSRFTHDLAARTISRVLSSYKPQGSMMIPREFPILMRQQPGNPKPVKYPPSNKQERLNQKRMRAAFLREPDHLPTIIADSLASFVHASATDPSAPFPTVYREAAKRLHRCLTFDETPAPVTKTRRKK